MPKIPERWKKIPGWDNYEVSNQGRVRSLGSYCKGRSGGIRLVPGRILKAQLANGRLIVTLCKPGKQTTYGVAYLVLWAFVRPPKEKEQARHYHDPDPYNCNLGNLCWGTKSDNRADYIRHHGEDWMSQKVYTEEERRHLSEVQVKRHQEKPFTEETRAKLAAVRLGKKWSPEVRQKMSQSQYRRWKMYHSKDQTLY